MPSRLWPPTTRDEHDEFDSGELGPNWNTLRVPFTDAMGTVGGGKLALRGQGSLCNLFDCLLWLVAGRHLISTPKQGAFRSEELHADGRPDQLLR